MMVLLLLAQAALAIAFFADQSWQKKLPPDETAEAVTLCSPTDQPSSFGANAGNALASQSHISLCWQATYSLFCLARQGLWTSA